MDFLKSVVVGGFFVILPLVVVLFFASEAVQTLMELVEPVADLLPFGKTANLLLAGAAVALGCLLLCFAAGVLVRTRWGAALVDWLERALLEKVPMYSTIRSLGRQVAGEASDRFVPAEVDLFGARGRVLAMIVERLPDGRLLTFVPTAPTSTVGQLHLVWPEQVRELDVSLADFAGCIGQWGVDAARLYRKGGDRSPSR